jgi:hypothetical protein
MDFLEFHKMLDYISIFYQNKIDIDGLDSVKINEIITNELNNIEQIEVWKLREQYVTTRYQIHREISINNHRIYAKVYTYATAYFDETEREYDSKGNVIELHKVRKIDEKYPKELSKYVINVELG